MSGYARPRRIREDDDLDAFDCGVDALTHWLQHQGRASDRSGMSTVYVTARDGIVVGNYGLASSTIEHVDAVPKVGRGMPLHPIPAVLITRLAVTTSEQRKGLGRHLLRDALVRSATAADIAGVRAVHVHAKTPEARRFYERHGFAPSPVDPSHLQLTIKTIRASIAAS